MEWIDVILISVTINVYLIVIFSFVIRNTFKKRNKGELISLLGLKRIVEKKKGEKE